MRKLGQVQEYVKWGVPGTFNPTEVKNPLCGQMMYIPSNIVSDDLLIIYKQLSNGTQIDPIGDPITVTFDNNATKLVDHTMAIDPTQQDFITTNPRWILTINILDIFNKLVFALLKSRRPFEGIFPVDTSEDDIDNFVSDYILNNILPRINWDHINFYVRFKKNGGTTPISLWTTNITYPHNIVTNYSSQYDNASGILTVNYTQAQPVEYSMEYYFNIYWVKT